MISYAQLDESETPIYDLVLSLVPKKGIDSPTLWDRYEKACKRFNILPLPGQVRTACVNLLKDGKLVRKGDKVYLA